MEFRKIQGISGKSRELQENLGDFKQVQGLKKIQGTLRKPGFFRKINLSDAALKILRIC